MPAQDEAVPHVHRQVALVPVAKRLALSGPAGIVIVRVAGFHGVAGGVIIVGGIIILGSQFIGDNLLHLASPPGRGDQGRVQDGARPHQDAMPLKLFVNHVQQLGQQPSLLQVVAKVTFGYEYISKVL